MIKRIVATITLSAAAILASPAVALAKDTSWG